MKITLQQGFLANFVSRFQATFPSTIFYMDLCNSHLCEKYQQMGRFTCLACERGEDGINGVTIL